MAIPQNTPSNEVVISTGSHTISEALSIAMVAPVTGKIVRGYHVVTATAHTGTNGTWTVQVNDTALTGTGTVITSSSATGDRGTVVYSGPVGVNAGDKVEVVVGGEGDAGTANFYLVIRT